MGVGVGVGVGTVGGNTVSPSTYSSMNNAAAAATLGMNSYHNGGAAAAAAAMNPQAAFLNPAAHPCEYYSFKNPVYTQLVRSVKFIDEAERP